MSEKIVLKIGKDALELDVNNQNLNLLKVLLPTNLSKEMNTLFELIKA